MLDISIIPSTGEDHSMTQLAIIDVPEVTLPRRVKQDDTVSPRVKNNKCKLTPHHDCLLRAIGNANKEGENLVGILYGPINTTGGQQTVAS